MFKSALISLLLTFTFSNAQFIPASTGGFYDLRGSPTALPGLSATGSESGQRAKEQTWHSLVDSEAKTTAIIGEAAAI